MIDFVNVIYLHNLSLTAVPLSPPASTSTCYFYKWRLQNLDISDSLPQQEVNLGNVSENFKRWKQKLEVYLAASGAFEKDERVQTAIILNCAGPHVLEVYEKFGWPKLDKPIKVLEALERYHDLRDNDILVSHRFWNIPYQDLFNKFLTELKTKAASCYLQEKDRMMRDKIVSKLTGKLQELLLREDSLTLEKAVNICRAFEQSTKQIKGFRDNNNDDDDDSNNNCLYSSCDPFTFLHKGK